MICTTTACHATGLPNPSIDFLIIIRNVWGHVMLAKQSVADQRAAVHPVFALRVRVSIFDVPNPSSTGTWCCGLYPIAGQRSCSWMPPTASTREICTMLLAKASLLFGHDWCIPRSCKFSPSCNTWYRLLAVWHCCQLFLPCAIYPILTPPGISYLHHAWQKILLSDLAWCHPEQPIRLSL